MLHVTPEDTSNRRYDLDWLRVIAFGILIFYHIGMFYVSWGWHVNSVYAGPVAEPLMVIVNPWRLALLFFISGVAVRFATDKAKGIGHFVRSRVVRLGVPIAFGMIFIVAPQSYLELVENGEFTGGFLEFWPRYLSLEQQFSIITPTWNHLWYVVYLLTYITVLAPIFPFLRKFSLGLGKRIVGFLSRTPITLLLITIVPFVFYELVLTPRFPTTNALFGDWANHAHRLTIFLLGFVVAKNSSFWDGVSRAFSIAASLVIVLIISGLLMDLYETQIAASFLARIPGINAILTTVDVLYAWSFIVFLLGMGQRFLNRSSIVLSYLTGAVFCYYILHQTITIVAGYWLTRFQMGVEKEFLLLVFITVAGCAAGYELIRRIPLLRVCFGIRAPRPVRHSGMHPAAA